MSDENKALAGTFRIQVRDPEGIRTQTAADKIFDATPDYVDKIASTINAFSGEMLNRIAAAGKPTSIKLEFGVNAGIKAGVPFVTEGKVDAHVTVEVEWDLRGH
jgi:hypothetical protein